MSPPLTGRRDSRRESIERYYPFRNDSETKDEAECKRGLAPQPAGSSVGDLLARPVKKARRIDDHRNTGQDLAGEGVDLLRQFTEQRRRRRFFRLGAALHGDQRAKLFDELCSCRVVLQGVHEPLEFVDRDRRRLGRGRRLRCSRACR